MAEAVVTLRADGRSLLETLGRVRASGSATARALSSDFARAAAEAGAAWEATCRGVARGYAELARINRARADEHARSARVVQNVDDLEATYRTSAFRRSAESAIASDARVTSAVAAGSRTRMAALAREYRDATRQVQAYARAHRAAMGIVNGAARVVGVVNAIAGAVGGAGDEVRQRALRMEQLNLRATQVAAGDIGDARAAPQITQAVRAISQQTGLAPEDVMEAAAHAQSEFSQLGNAGDRQRYLTQVLPQLARSAAASGGSLSDMVGEAGEMQRQLGVSNEDLPRAIAMATAQGRFGSISERDTARSMGQIGGRAARFLATDPAHAMESLAVTGALMQESGNGGGGGAEAATRTRAFLDNFSSHRGQERLTGLLGHGVLGADGQLRTRRGESQGAALQRTIEEAWEHSAGNADTFATAIAGNNTRARGLADQFARDLRTHGGHLSGFAQTVSAGLGATPENTTGAAWDAVAGTDAVQRAKQENRIFFGEQDRNTPERDTDRAWRDLREQHPKAAWALGMIPGGEGIFRGGMDALTTANGGALGRTALDGPTTTARMDLHNTAFAQASDEWNKSHGFLARTFTTDATRSREIDTRTSDLQERMAGAYRAHPEDLDRVIQLAQGATVELGPTSIAAIERSGKLDPHDAAHAATQAAAGPHGARRNE